MIRAILAGAAGRMGGRVLLALAEAGDLKLTGAFERPDHPAVGQDAGTVAGLGPLAVPIAASLDEVIEKGDVLIDFTTPTASVSHLEKVAKKGKAAVVGTTGFDEAQRKTIHSLGRSLRAVVSPNMSVGVNVMLRLVGEAARLLGPDFDVEVLEAHHNLKKDAPSGTALALARTVAESLGRDLKEVGVFGREGLIGERKKGEIGIMSLRAGDLVGEHLVLFAGVGERLELTHRAHSRDNFARGALRAARWVVSQPPGIYSMADVLGLTRA